MIDTEPADFHRVVAGRFTAVVDGVANWDAPSPVAEWTARDVVRHLTDWFPGFLAAGTSVTLPTGPAVDDDPAGAWRAQADSVQAVLDDPATASKILHDPNVGDVALPEAISQFYTVDVFMHTWDLARATRQDDTLDADLCASLLAGLEPIDDVLRSSGHYGPKVDVPADADEATRLLAFIGRDPSWRPPR